MRMRPWVGGVCVVLLVAAGAHAALFVVNDTANAFDANAGDGVCADAMGRCTWLAAVDESNALAGADVIALPAGTYAGESAFLADDVEVIGQGVGSTILDGEGTRRLMYVDDGVVAIVRGVTFTDGASSQGAAISNVGDLTVRDSSFTLNAASLGGAILSSSPSGGLTVERTTFSGNSAESGAGIFADLGPVTVRSSTFHNNSSTANASAIHMQTAGGLDLENVTVVGSLGGPAVILASGTSGTITHSTIASNENTGLQVHTGASLTIANSIVANNGLSVMSADDCFAPGTVTSLGGNLSSDATCKFVAGSDLETAEPRLFALADNGGPTQTVALMTSSPALDTAGATECLATDQRGAPRPAGSGCDRGAYELDAVVPPTTTTTFPTTTTSSSNTTTSTSSSTTSSTTTSTAASTSSTTTTTSSTTTSSTSTTIAGSTTSTSVVSSTTTTAPPTSTTSTTLGSTSSTTVPSTTSTSTTTMGTTTSTTVPSAVIFPTAKKLLVKRKKSGAQRLMLVVKDPAVAAPLPCETAGDLLIEAVGAGVPPVAFGLDAALWKPIKARKPGRGCKYRKGPVAATVLVKAGKGLKVIATADDLGVPLATDPRPVRIELRHGDVRHCVELGGEASKHVPDKKLLAKRAVAATTCPGTPSP